MAILIKDLHSPKRRLVIDIDGPSGNAYALLGYAKNLSSQLKLNYSDIQKEMTLSDYENLIEVFDKYFGKYCDLERSSAKHQALC